MRKEHKYNPIVYVDIRIRNGSINLHAENLEQGGALYTTSAGGELLHHFVDEQRVTKINFLAYYATVEVIVNKNLIGRGIDTRGLGKEVAFKIMFANIKE